MSRSRWYRVLVALIAMSLLQSSTAEASVDGDPRAYALLGGGARWDPCGGPITYRVDLDRAPDGSLAEVGTAFARVGRATGLRFRYAGPTAAVPFPVRLDPAAGVAGAYPAGTDIVVAWAYPGQQSLLIPAGSVAAGEGGAMWSAASSRISRGHVVLNAEVAGRMARGFGAAGGGTTGALLMHEIGHAVGLDHPAGDDRDEIMYPVITAKPASWGAGDLTGLRVVGASRGCVAG